ncbi:STAS domain-containing protein [bacterium]|nr:STAS domain-containing protein [bacterium]MBU1984350.1 STAS domain-containing protein [bacterium]
MKTTATLEGDVKIIILNGKILSSQDTADMHIQVRTALEQNIKKVVLDLSGLDWTGSTGLGALVAVQGRLRNVDGHLKLAGVNPTVGELLKLNKLNLVFEMYPTVAEAVAHFK